MPTRRFALVVTAAGLALLAACRRSAPPAAPAGEPDAAPAAGNRIAVPAAVRDNLGITFAAVEVRAVTRTLRAPGRFELLPQARREYRTMLGGRVELAVAQYDAVAAGDLLYTLDSPAWRELQERLSETVSQIEQARARVANIDPQRAAHERHHDELETGVTIWTERVRQLEAAGGSGAVTADELAQARAALVTIRAALAEVLEKEAELRARQAEVQADLHAARERFDLLLMNASTLLDLPVERLLAEDPSQPPHVHPGDYPDAQPHRHPFWRELQRVDVRATEAGVVETLSLTNGAWATETSLVLATVQPQRLRFRARGLQSDLGRLRNGLPATIVPPQGGSMAEGESVGGRIALGISGDPDERTIEILLVPERPPAWARPGVTAQLEIVTGGGAAGELAIPLAATIRDGLQTVFFRRDPRDPDQVLRVTADLGPDDGRWVVVRSGVKEGDEVVVDGVYQLMLATSGTAVKGGHFHADGTFHAEEH